MQYSEEQLALEMLNIFAKANKSLFRINILGRPFQEGNLELSLKAKFTDEERALASKVFRLLESDEYIIPTFDDVIAPGEKFKITAIGSDASAKKSIRLSSSKDIYLEGKVKENQYKLLDRIGSGGFGDVYEALDDINKKTVAIKIFQNRLNLTDSHAIETWTREAEQALKIQDTNVIKSDDFRKGLMPDGSEKYYLVMELADGGSLDDLIKNQKVTGSFFDDQRLKELFLDTLKGMKAIHSIALHRDLKPENILFVNGILKISDFGLARYVDEITRTRTFKGWGTPPYMAPETWRRGDMSKATDIYSLGIMFYQLASLELPYSSGDDFELEKLHRFETIPSAKKINTQLSYKIEGIIKRMMQKSSIDRYQDVSEIIEDLMQDKPKTAIDVSRTIEVAKQILEKEEQGKNEILKKQEEERTKRSTIKYKVSELVESIETFIESINADLPEGKLFLSKGSETSYTLIWRDKDLLRIEFNCELFDSGVVIKGLQVVALGTAQLIMGRQYEGTNFILVQDEGNEYGVWKVLEISTSPLVPQTQYPRLADLDSLHRITQLGNTMDWITHEIRDDINEELKITISQAFSYFSNPPNPVESISDNFLSDDDGFGI